MSRLVTSLFVVFLIAVSLVAGCAVLDESAERSASAPADGVTSIRIVAEAGSLEVRGEPGLREVRASGTAYASSRARLENIQFVLTVNGSELLVEARTPDSNTRFDVVITLPSEIDVVIDDGSGNLIVRNAGSVAITDGSGNIDVSDVDALMLTDGSGNVHIERIDGDVVIDDGGSGNLRISQVAGSVLIEVDGSGDIDVTDVGRDVRIGDDGSGNISITRVTGSVDIGADGSGDINVANIGGDFAVGSDGSGTIRHTNVAGTVALP